MWLWESTYAMSGALAWQVKRYLIKKRQVLVLREGRWYGGFARLSLPPVCVSFFSFYSARTYLLPRSATLCNCTYNAEVSELVPKQHPLEVPTVFVSFCANILQTMLQVQQIGMFLIISCSNYYIDGLSNIETWIQFAITSYIGIILAILYNHVTPNFFYQ